MGCDIHLYSETKKNGQWVADAADSFYEEKEAGDDYAYASMDSPYRERNYELFGLLSEGVRRETAHAFPQQGFPADVSDEVRRVYEPQDGYGDAHSVSHLTLAELQYKAAELLILGDPLLGDLSYLLKALPASEASPEDRRIVFWFDN